MVCIHVENLEIENKPCFLAYWLNLKKSQLHRIQVDRTSHLLGTVFHTLATKMKG